MRSVALLAVGAALGAAAVWLLGRNESAAVTQSS